MIAFLSGFTAVFTSLHTLFKPGIRSYVLIPLVINITIFSSLTYWITQKFDQWMEQLLPGWLSWLEWLLWPLFAILIFIALFYSFTILANLIAAPFNSRLSAKIESHLTGSTPETGNSAGLFKLIIRTTGSELTKISYFMKWFIVLLIITFIPIINVVAPIAWLAFSAWSLSLEYTDYPLGNRGLSFTEVKDYNRSHRMKSLGLGAGIMILTIIPLINFIAMPTAVIAATKINVNDELN